ncbi:MAG: Gfo/Idh/MocA family oxidoreductase [Chloroflexi bacterium OHK40]
MSIEPLRMIVAGAGGMGRAWLRTLAADPRWTVAALVDTSAEALHAAGESFAVPVERRFASAAEALERAPADAILVATTPETHHAIIVPALERGMPVFSEKPLTATLPEAVAVLAAARRSRAPLMVGQGRRWLPHIVALREVLQGGLIGEPGYLTCQFRIPFRFGGWRDAMPEVLLEDMAIHHFDAIRFVTGRNGARVFAHSFRPAWSWFQGNACAGVELLLEGGLPVSYFGSWVARGPRSSWDGEVIVAGAEGALLLRDDESLWHYPGESETPRQLVVPPLEPVGLARGLDCFTRAVRGEAPPDPDGEDNIHSLAITSAAVASARSGLPVDVAAHLHEAGWRPI